MFSIVGISHYTIHSQYIINEKVSIFIKGKEISGQITTLIISTTLTSILDTHLYMYINTAVVHIILL